MLRWTCRKISPQCWHSSRQDSLQVACLNVLLGANADSVFRWHPSRNVLPFNRRNTQVHWYARRFAYRKHSVSFFTKGGEANGKKEVYDYQDWARCQNGEIHPCQGSPAAQKYRYRWDYQAQKSEILEPANPWKVSSIPDVPPQDSLRTKQLPLVQMHPRCLTQGHRGPLLSVYAAIAPNCQERKIWNN